MSTQITTVLQDISLENIVTVNQTSLVKNFKLIIQCLNHFTTLQQKIKTLETNNDNIFLEIQKSKKKYEKQEKQFSQVKEIMKEVTETLDIDTSFVEGTTEAKGKSSHKVARPSNPSKTNSQYILSEIKTSENRLRNEIKSQLQQLREEQQLIINRKEQKDNIEQINAKLMDQKIQKINQTLQNITNQIKQSIKEDGNHIINLQRQLGFLNIRIQEMERSNEAMRSIQTNIDEKIKLKADSSDLIKLEQMLLGMFDSTMNQMVKKLADKQETKKGLVFLEKRINKVVQLMVGDTTDEDKNAMIATKGWKCVSCTKNLGQYEGKLDQFKPWAVFPTKPITKDKYHGFGLGFQETVEKAVQKRGMQTNYDSYGRMTNPHNLTRQVNIGVSKSGTPSNVKTRSQSQSKLKNTSMMETSSPLETNYMNNFGGNYEPHINITEQYKRKYKGINSYIIDLIKDGLK